MWVIKVLTLKNTDMKKILLFITLIAVGSMTVNAQMAGDTLVAFEAVTDTAGWLVFANGANPADDDVTVVENPDTTGVNPTAMALRFVVNADADPWAGMVKNDYYVGDSAIAITEENHMVTIMVYKDRIDSVGIKFEGGLNNAPNFELKVSNTVINEWEVLTFDFSEIIGNTYEALVLFPDFPNMREAGAVVYLDNVILGEAPATSVSLFEKMPLRVYPNPAENRLHIQHPQMTGFVISNSLGQRVETMNFGETDFRTIEIDRLKSGIHFITVQSRSGVHTTRFIKR
jgi:hypothetical protein